MRAKRSNTPVASLPAAPPACAEKGHSPHLYCLAGATATGKSAVVQYLAERYGAAIVSADAMLVYQGMDIGTAKPSQEERARVPYLGLDCVTPAENFSTAAWLKAVQVPLRKDARGSECSALIGRCAPCRADIPSAMDPAEESCRAEGGRGSEGEARTVGAQPAYDTRSSIPLFATGGTGLYFSALLRGLEPTPPGDPEVRARLEALDAEELRRKLRAKGAQLPENDWANPRRLVRALEILELGGELPKGWGAREKPVLPALTWERAALHARIAHRVDAMYRDGLLDETATLRKRFPVWSRTAAQAIGYAEAMAVLEGALTVAEAKERTVIRTRQLARRQETYLRHQFDVRWIRVTEADDLPSLAARVEAIWGLRA